MTRPTETPAPEQLYAEVQQFYARHIQLVDEGPADEAADTFAEDASMLSPPKIAEPIVGRAALAAGLRRNLVASAQAGEVYRRCYTTMAVRPERDGRLHVRSYVQVYVTPHGGQPVLRVMCVCEDVLVRERGVLKVERRVVTRDDLRRAVDPDSSAGF